MRYVNHQFFPSGTITAVIRLYNGVILTEDEMRTLVDRFNILNDFAVPRVGSFAKIPLLDHVTPPNVEVHVHGE